jgi:hypothetical protein
VNQKRFTVKLLSNRILALTTVAFRTSYVFGTSRFTEDLMSLFTGMNIAQSVDGGIGPERVISETGNSRQCGANRDLVHGNLAIPYQRRIDIRFVPIFPNACLLARAGMTYPGHIG